MRPREVRAPRVGEVWASTNVCLLFAKTNAACLEGNYRPYIDRFKQEFHFLWSKGLGHRVEVLVNTTDLLLIIIACTKLYMHLIILAHINRALTDFLSLKRGDKKFHAKMFFM